MGNGKIVDPKEECSSFISFLFHDLEVQTSFCRPTSFK